MLSVRTVEAASDGRTSSRRHPTRTARLRRPGATAGSQPGDDPRQEETTGNQEKHRRIDSSFHLSLSIFDFAGLTVRLSPNL